MFEFYKSLLGAGRTVNRIALFIVVAVVAVVLWSAVVR